MGYLSQITKWFSTALLYGGLCCASVYAQPSASSASAEQGVAAPVPEMSSQVARVVVGMLGYTYWPQPQNERILCVLPGSAFGAALVERVPAADGREKWRATQMELLDSEAALTDCHAVYVSANEAKEHAALLRSVQRKPVMTIIENSPYCDEGALFCIDARAGQRVTFQVNLDAMALSTLRVNPQVLRMGRDQERSSP